MLATTLNVEFDPDLSFDEKKEVYRISNKIVRTMNVTQSAVGDKRGLWTTVLGAAILIGEDDYASENMQYAMFGYGYAVSDSLRPGARRRRKSLCVSKM